MANTKRSNEPFKRHHWKSARTERRGRFAHAAKLFPTVAHEDMDAADPFFEAVDQDLHFRRRGGWITADKKHIRFLLERGAIHEARAELLKRKLHLRGA
ncbi:MAG TPA: hypothetical protein VM889_12450 [Candidatus Thermoplasmatota archaeon]|nr:hypothetical protein [Candidatus Thermoplasmatota archaeon]